MDAPVPSGLEVLAALIALQTSCVKKESGMSYLVCGWVPALFSRCCRYSIYGELNHLALVGVAGIAPLNLISMLFCLGVLVARFLLVHQKMLICC